MLNAHDSWASVGASESSTQLLEFTHTQILTMNGYNVSTF